MCQMSIQYHGFKNNPQHHQSLCLEKRNFMALYHEYKLEADAIWS